MFANTQMGGMNSGFPDVCITPVPSPLGPVPTPLPYPNESMTMMGVEAVDNILIGGAPAHNLATEIPMSNGDNAGTLLGVVSGTVMGPTRTILGAESVLFGGMPATRLTSMTIQNSTNCPGACMVPSQSKLLILAP
ncbi:MAG: type secretion protein [Solimicrobium sp.]|jgi:hypothetical protein|nr:type secretion protein [Solimicrobium sp.]